MEKNVIPSCLTFSKACESIQAWPHIVQKEKSRLHGLLQSEARWEDVFLMPYGFTCLFKPFSDWPQGIIYPVLERALIWINNNPNFIFSLPMRVPGKNSPRIPGGMEGSIRGHFWGLDGSQIDVEETGGIPERVWMGSGMKELWALESGCCHLLVFVTQGKERVSAPQL